jgi:small subunit ribosomal protein S20
MPITSSAKKALRASHVKRVYNLRLKAAIDEPVKEIKKLVTAKKKAEAQKLLPAVYKALDKAAKKNYIKKNTASRTKSRISTLVKNIA